MTGILATIGILIIIFGIMHPIRTIKYIFVAYIAGMFLYILIMMIPYLISLLPF